MRVFVLCTGRSGSSTFYNACQHIKNFTNGHEHRKSFLGEERFAYPDQHIEIDNRLSWFLGSMEKRFGDDPIYVHLIRDRMATARSFSKRSNHPGSIIEAFTDGVKNLRPWELKEEQRLELALDYTDAVTENIEFFLKNKTKKMTFHLDNFETDFKQFWDLIGAEGDYEEALRTFTIKANAHGDHKFNMGLFQLKSTFMRLIRFRS